MILCSVRQMCRVIGFAVNECESQFGKQNLKERIWKT